MIRECTLKDVISLQYIATKTFVDTFEAYNTPEDMEKYLKKAYSIEKLQNELLKEESRYYVLEIDNHVKGYLKLNWGNEQSEPMGKDTLEIQCLYIDVQYKRNGYGKKLIDFSVEKALELQKNSVWLGVWENNTNAIAFYQSLGFKKTGSHSFWVGDDEQIDFIMTLHI